MLGGHVASRHPGQSCETRQFTQSAPGQPFTVGTVCECWGEPQEIQLLSAGLYKKDGVYMLLLIAGNVI